MSKINDPIDPQLDLVLERVVPLPPELIWQAWTTPALLHQWFAPHPWQAGDAELELREGGGFKVIMRSPEGQPMPCEGCYLQIIPNKRLVWTDTLLSGYRPAPNPFFTAILTLEPHSQGTFYRVIARHKDEASKKQHEEMGFHPGWNQCLDQLITLMQGNAGDARPSEVRA